MRRANGAKQIEIAGIDVPTYIPAELWQAWLAMRREKKHPITPGAIRIAIGRLERIRKKGMDPAAAIEEATLRGWAGIFELKCEPKPSVADTVRAAGEKVIEKMTNEELAKGVPMPDDVRAQMYRTFGRDITKTRH